ncbi:MAG: hypothetical protein KDA72_17740 [Planctomycetales bacterium]|nr:hypothetical protein [Planctomycetales bacterium]
MLRTSMAVTLLSTLLSGGLFDEVEHRRGREKSSTSQPNNTESMKSAEKLLIEQEARMQLGRELMGRK